MKYLLFLSFLFCISCGMETQSISNEPTPENDNPDDTSLNISELGTETDLAFNFAIRILSETDSDIDFTIPFPGTFTAPMYVLSDGTVSMRAGDFPRMVFRVCKTDSATSGCMSTSTDPNLLYDVDIVTDSCGTDTDDKYCGQEDSTVYTGVLKSDGSLYVNSISIRLRIFMATSSTNGYTALDSNLGLFTDPPLSRMLINISTANVASGSLSATGSRVSDSQVTLVSAGLIPDDFPSMAGAYYLSSITGTFNVDPLSLLE